MLGRLFWGSAKIVFVPGHFSVSRKLPGSTCVYKTKMTQTSGSKVAGLQGPDGWDGVPFQARSKQAFKSRKTLARRSRPVPGKNEAIPKQNRGNFGFASVSLGTGFRGNQTAKFTGETRGQGRESNPGGRPLAAQEGLASGGALAERSRAQTFNLVRKFAGDFFLRKRPRFGHAHDHPGA